MVRSCRVQLQYHTSCSAAQFPYSVRRIVLFSQREVAQFFAHDALLLIYRSKHFRTFPERTNAHPWQALRPPSKFVVPSGRKTVPTCSLINSACWARFDRTIKPQERSLISLTAIYQFLRPEFSFHPYIYTRPATMLHADSTISKNF